MTSSATKSWTCPTTIVYTQAAANCHTYKHSHEEILARYGRQMKMCDRVPDVLSLDMGNQMYVATLDTATERDAFVRYVQEQAPAQAAKD